MIDLRGTLIAILSLALLGFGCTAREQVSKDYFPCEASMAWTYRTTQGTGEISESTKTVLSRVEQTGSDIRVTIDAGKVIEHYSLRKGSVFIEQLEIPEDEKVIEFPPNGCKELDATPEPGETWTYESEGASHSFEVVGLETVTVPAGEFLALRVDSEKNYGPFQMQESLWYASGVGLVKSRARGVQVDYVRELVEFARP